MNFSKSMMPRIVGALMALVFAGSAVAQEMAVGTDGGPAGGQATVPIDWTGDGTVDNITVWFDFDDSVITPEVTGVNNDVVGCLDGLPASHQGILTTCRNPAATPGRIVLVISDQAGAGSFPTTNVGTITFNIAGGATVPSSEPVVVDVQEATDSSLNDVTASVSESDGTVNILDVTAVLDVQPVNINFPATENGSSSSAQSFTISNEGTDNIDLEVTDVSLATGTHFSISANSCPASTPFTLADGESCTYDAVFSPTAIGNFNDTVTVTSDAGQVDNDQVALSGEGTAGPAATLDVAPASHDFGDVLTGDSATFTFTVSNTGESGSSLDIDAIGLGGGTDFSISGGSCAVGTTLGDGDSCTVAVDFAPAMDGGQNDTLTVDGTDTVNSTSLSDSAALDGNGVSEARFASDPAPGAVNMGLTPPGGSLNQTVVVTNEGNENLTVNNCTLNDPDGLFSITPDPIDFNIAPDGNDSFAVSCDVPAPGSFSASLSCDTNDPNNATVSYTFTCNGQILEIPTMQPWGLVLLTMLMLMIGGLSIRYFRI